MMLRYWHQRAD